MENLESIQLCIKNLSQRLSLPRGMVAFIQGKPVDDGKPYLEIGATEYHYVTRERGVELFRKTTDDLDDILYWFFDDLTSKISFDYEFENRVKSQDFRRLAFSKKTELLNKLNPSWGDRYSVELKELLAKHPYDDHSNERVDLCKKMSEEGLSANEAYEQACKEYPLPKKVKD